MILSKVCLVLYNIALHIVVLVGGVYFALRYREGFFQRIGFVNFPLKRGTRIWVHAVSVGEVVAASEFIRSLRVHKWRGEILLSTTTVTGMKVAKEMGIPVDYLFYYPVDLPLVVQKVLRNARADLMVFVETELWPNMVSMSFHRGIKLALVNGRLSSKSFHGYLRIRPLVNYMLSMFSVLCMVSEKDAARVIQLGANKDNVFVVGNIKHSATLRRRDSVKLPAVKEWMNVCDKDKVWVAGSTHRGEEEVVAEVFKRLKKYFPDLILVVAPRHPERTNEVLKILEDYGFKPVRRSGILKRSKDNDCIVVDTIGELFGIYGVSTVAFCGGSFVPKGGQNIVEPAVWGRPVLYGPYMDDFLLEAKELNTKGGFQVNDSEEMFSVLRRLLSDELFRRHCGRMAVDTVNKLCAGADRCIDKVFKLIEGGGM